MVYQETHVREFNVARVVHVPEGFIAGQKKLGGGILNPLTLVSHLYKGSFDDIPKDSGMCRHSYGPDGSISIWRNMLTAKGICSVCLKRAIEGKDPIPWKSSKQK